MPLDCRLFPTGEGRPSQTLGNALFQLASTLGVAASRGEEARFPAEWPYRPYFRLPAELFIPAPGAPEAFTLPELDHIDERARIYMQDISLFAAIMPTIREYLSPSDLALKALDQQHTFNALPRPVLSVHVRRTDKIPYGHGGPDPGEDGTLHRCASLGYYQRAIAGYPEAASVAIFSDDIGWCRDCLTADYFHEGIVSPRYESDPAPMDWIDLFLMASADAHCVTGSTFGVWGALLSGDTDATYAWPVYAERLAFIDASLLFPSTWRRLDA